MHRSIIPPWLNNYKHSLTLGSQKNTTLLCNCSCMLIWCLLLISNGIHSNCMAFSVLFKGHQLVPFPFIFFFNNKKSPLVSYKGAFTWYRFTSITESFRQKGTSGGLYIQLRVGPSPKLQQVFSGPCPVGIWVSSRIRVLHPLCATWSSVSPLSSCRYFP